MANYPPSIDILPNAQATIPSYLHLKPWYHSRRFIIFLGTFLLSTAISLSYLYSRPAQYRSAATLLTSAMTAIDKDRSAVDTQHVEIQKNILLGHELLTETLARLTDVKLDHIKQLTLSNLQSILTVEPIQNTNMVEILAEGRNAEILPVIINTWIDVYLDARKEDVKKLTQNTTQIIQDELKGLEQKISAKRDELEHFRLTNDILSTGRDENEALARLKGINDTLNRAIEEEVKAKANLDAVKLAIEQQQPVVPKQDQGILQNLEKRRQELKEKQARLKERFTQDYIDLQPTMKIVPSEIAKIENEIKNQLNYGKTVVLSEAKKDYSATKETVKAVRAQLENHKKQASHFTKQFAQHETLKTDLEGLERLYREAHERLVQIQTSYKEKYPQVNVISKAYQPDKPISPHYHRDAVFAVAGSFLLGLFSLWLVDYINKKPIFPVPPIIFSGFPLARRATDNAPTLNDFSRRSTDLNRRVTDKSERMPNLIASQPADTSQNNQLQTNKILPGPPARELSCYELDLLLNHANLKGKQLISCLLSGLSPDEIAGLSAHHMDLTTNKILIGEPLRTLPLHSSIKALFQQSGGKPDWVGSSTLTLNELKSSLYYAAIDSGLSHPEEINAENIRHSYIAFLVRQGLRLSDLTAVVGYLPPELIASYSAYAPPDRGHRVDEIELLHPALLDITH